MGKEMGTSKPPRPFKQTAPDRVEMREGGGCLSIFGIPFLAGGVFAALIGAQVIPVSNRNEVPAWVYPVIFLMGLVFVAVGGALVFGRRWTTLDSGKGLVVKQSGLLVPLQKQQFQISDYDRVFCFSSASCPRSARSTGSSDRSGVGPRLTPHPMGSRSMSRPHGANASPSFPSAKSSASTMVQRKRRYVRSPARPGNGMPAAVRRQPQARLYRAGPGG